MCYLLSGIQNLQLIINQKTSYSVPNRAQVHDRIDPSVESHAAPPAWDQYRQHAPWLRILHINEMFYSNTLVWADEITQWLRGAANPSAAALPHLFEDILDLDGQIESKMKALLMSYAIYLF